MGRQGGSHRWDPFFESEDTQHVGLRQLRVDIRHVAIDEAGRLMCALWSL